MRDLLRDIEFIGPVLAFVFTVGGFIGFAWFAAKQEAVIFNRCTGSSITTWDALWADFRVIDCKQAVGERR